MEIKKNITQEELKNGIKGFMMGVESSVRYDQMIALLECTEYDKENGNHKFTGLELAIIPKDYASSDYEKICDVDTYDRTRYHLGNEFYDRADIVEKIIETVNNLLEEYAEYAKN